MSEVRNAKDAQVREQLRSLQAEDGLTPALGSVLSHELRTPLSAILALSELLLGRTDGPLTGGQEKQVEYIHAAAQALLRLVEDLLQLASIEYGNAVLELTSFSVSDLFAELHEMLPAVAELDFDDSEGLPLLRTDRKKLAQALRALVVNAGERSGQGRVRVSAAAGDAGETVFCVSESVAADDAGCESEGLRASGSSLGLPLCFRLAELLGGRLSFESEQERGSRFLLSVGPASRAEAIAPPAATGGPDRPGRLLLIDDNEADRYLVTRSLTRLGHEVRTAASGAAGLEAARSDPPDVVIADLRMPGIDGFDVLEQLRSDPATREIPIIVHTGLGLESLEALLVGGRGIHFVDKGQLGSGRLAATVAELLAQIRAS
ncbi:MAG: response regulator [Gaiellaceae bacterium]